MIKRLLVIGLFFLLVVSFIGSLSFGNKLKISNDKINFNKHDILNYNNSVFSIVVQPTEKIYNNKITPTLNKNTNNNIFSNTFVEGPWPMYCHDVRHTSRSPYSTANTDGLEKWRYDMGWVCTGSPIIDNNGIIYVGSYYMYAIYPNGTLKWLFNSHGRIVSAPAIDDNGVLYFGGIWEEYLYAVYSDNGTEKWRYSIGYTWASPTIGTDGIIYAPATDNWNVIAFYPNGTVKWCFHANERVFSSPAIGDDGTVYCTSYGSYLYALYPENGTVKWQYHTGGLVRTSPCIADDGTIYVVSVNGVLHALFPNGTLKWQQTSIDGGTSPTIGQDGTIYCGYHQLYAINPDSSVKWVFNLGEGRSIKEGTPCNSLDDTIYFGTYISYSTQADGGEIIAVNLDGTERWRLMIATDWVMSAPAIGSDGTVYVGSDNDGSPPYSWGYLHAIGPLDPNAPSAPVIDGPVSGCIKKAYNFTINSTSPLGRDVYYYIDWDDHTATKWVGPYTSGEEVIINHSWLYKRTFKIKARAKDTENLWGPWGELEVTIPRNKIATNTLLLRFLERFPLLERLLFFVKMRFN